MNTLDLLIKNLSRLPGVGKKSATRIAYYLLKKDQSFLDSLAGQISTIKTKIRTCSVCGNYTENDPCEVCTDLRRDRTLVCVVENSQDVNTIESTNEYHGLFHVLGGVVSPIDGVGPSDLTIDRLVRRVREGEIREVIIATNPNVEGDTTALYVARALKDAGVAVSRLASGLPVGGDLEYAGSITLSRSLKGRIPLS